MRDDDEALRALARAGERLAQIIGVERGEPEEERQRSALGGVCGPWFSGMEPSTSSRPATSSIRPCRAMSVRVMIVVVWLALRVRSVRARSPRATPGTMCTGHLGPRPVVTRLRPGPSGHYDQDALWSHLEGNVQSPRRSRRSARRHAHRHAATGPAPVVENPPAVDPSFTLKWRSPRGRGARPRRPVRPRDARCVGRRPPPWDRGSRR